MYYYIIAFFAGTLILQFFQQLPSLVVVLAILTPLALIAIFKRWRWARLCLCAGIGLLWSLIFAFHIMNSSLPKSKLQKIITVKGYILSVLHKDELREKFLFADGKTIMQLSWYGDYPDLKNGDKWRLQVKLKKPYGSMNPGEFDYEKYLFQHHIRAIGYVRNSSLNQRLSSHWFHHPISRFRQYLAAGIRQALDDEPLTGIIIALVVGERNDLTAAEWQVFRNTGTSHLTAISGLHIGLVAGLIFLFAQFIWRRIPKLTLYLPAPKAGAIGAILGALFYSGMAGFALPTERAVIMISVFSLALLLSRNIKPWHAFFIALFFVCFINPLASLTIGFWLSFAAVAVLIYCFSGRVAARGLWWKWGRSQLVVGIGLLPLSLMSFQQFSLGSFLANIVAIPIVGCVVVPLSLLGSLIWLISASLGGWILLLAEKILQLLWLLLSWLAAQPWLIWHHALANGWVLLTAIVGCLLLLAPKGVPARFLGLIWLLPLIFYTPPGPKSAGEVWFTLLDVGQGLATVVRTKQHVLIYDTGPKYSDSFDAGSAMVVPFLYKQGINRVSMLVVSHGDNDHIGGAASVLQMVRVKKIMSSVPKKFQPNYRARHCWAGQHWRWDGVDFQFLSPEKGLGLTGNAASCVLKITTGKNSILLPGDIEASTERILVPAPNQLKSTILVAPHHGSISSSTPAFVAAVRPNYLLFPIGYENRYHFPSKKVVARYQNIKAKLYNTASSGAITFKFSRKQQISIPQQYRKLFHHYWNNS